MDTDRDDNFSKMLAKSKSQTSKIFCKSTMGTETPKSRPSHVESYSSGRMRIPVVDLNRKPTL